MQSSNTFENGMVWDSLPETQPQGTYRFAYNAVTASREYFTDGLLNEEDRRVAATLSAPIVGKSYIKERHQTLYFTEDDSLYLFDNHSHSVKFVASGTEFGCTWNFKKCEFLYAEFKYFNKCSELHAYWSSDCVYHVINIDEMLDPKRKAAVKMCEDCSYFDMFKTTCGPLLSTMPLEFAGGTITGGSVKFAVQLRDNDGNTTNVFDVSQPEYVETEDNLPNQVSPNGVRLIIDNLDRKYSQVVIYVIKESAGVTTVERLPPRSYGSSSLTFDYYGQRGETVDVSTIVNKSRAFLRGQDLIQKDGRMFFYNLKNEKNLNYQKYANEIELEWVEYEVSMEQNLKYNYPSLMRGEVYAPAIVFKYIDGTYSPAFHIPMCGVSSGGDDGDTSATVPDPPNSSIMDDGYNPIKLTDFDTTDEFERKRNPSVEDAPNESTKLVDAVRDSVNNMDTDQQDIIEAAECEDCPKVGEAYENDLADVSEVTESSLELWSLLGIDEEDPDVNVTTNWKDAALKLIDNAVKNREYVNKKRPTLNYTAVDSATTTTTFNDPTAALEETPSTFAPEGSGETTFKGYTPSGGETLRGDNWVDSVGNNLTEEPPRIVASGKFEVYESVVDYPDAKDCDGKFFYPQGKVCFPRVPWTSDRPHFVSYQNGVVSKYQPENYEYGDCRVRLIGLRVKNIHIPSVDELPKPLCPNSPYKIVYVKRTHENMSVFAKGWLGAIFEGSIYGKTHAFPRHGVNSFEHVDRFIASGEGGLSRMGVQSDRPIYTFHSPDTDCDRSYLPTTHLKGELSLEGNGWKHGVVSKGKPPENQWRGTQVDQRGTRVSNNLNHYSSAGSDVKSKIVGLTYAPSDSIVTPANGMSLPLMNRYRESSVYIETQDRLPGDERDSSFIGGMINHFGPTTCNAPYVAMIRELPDQYGGVENLQYIDLGLNATTAHSGGMGFIEGICGDSWIAPYSKRRTSYVSNLQGNYFNVPAKEGSECRRRSHCDLPDDKIFQYFGINYYPTILPKSGDQQDPKNYAGLHTVDGECGEFGLSRTDVDAAAIGVSESDFYWPRTLKSLVHSVVESNINASLRATGEGSQIETGQVYYPKLKDLTLDSDAPSQQPWEESFLNRFYSAIRQPSASKIALKALIRSFVNLIVPLYMLTQFPDVEGVVDGVLTVSSFSILSSLYVFLTNTLLTNDKLNDLLRIGDCRRDEQGGDLDDDIEQFEDAYARYNSDYHTPNDINQYSAFNLPYNTCDCLHEDTKIIMSDYSRCPIKNVKVGDLVKSYNTEKNEYVDKKVLNVWDKGDLDLYEIKFSNRQSVKASIDHKWFVRRRCKKDNGDLYPVEVVTTRDLLEQPKKWYILFANEMPPLNMNPITEEEAYLLGIYIAEGSVPSKKMGTDKYQNPKPYFEKFFISQLKEKSRQKIKEKLNRTNIKYSEHKKGFYLTDVGYLYPYLLEIPKGAVNKKIPQEVFKWNIKLLKAVYEGLMDGDGTRIPQKTFVHKTKGKITSKESDCYYTSSPQLAEDVKLLSWIIGKPMYLRSRGIVSGFGSDKEQYVLQGSHSLKAPLRGGKLFIKDIKPVGKGRAIDIEVEDTKSFILAETGAISHNCDDCDGGDRFGRGRQLTNEIYYSNKQNLDSEIDAYTNVKINNYNEVPTHKGHIQKLFIQGNNLYIHTNAGMLLATLLDQQVPQDIASQQSGTGTLLSEPLMIFEGVAEGFGGTQHPNASINTPFGYFFIDEKAKKVYRFNGSPEEISTYGMHSFFREHLSFCSPTSCFDEKTNNDSHYSMGWDNRYNRLLITKYDGDSSSSWTISYTPMGISTGNGVKGKWISFHSYTPQDYSWDRDKLYSIEGSTIYEHNVKGSYLTPFIVEFSSVHGGTTKFNHLTLNTIAEKYDQSTFTYLRDLDVTFNKLAVMNSTQGTGTRSVQHISDDSGERKNSLERQKSKLDEVRMTKNGRAWNTNELHDFIRNGCEHQPLTIRSSECQIIPDINEDIFDCSVLKAQDNKNRTLWDNHLIYRYTFDSTNDIRLVLLSHITETT